MEPTQPQPLNPSARADLRAVDWAEWMEPSVEALYQSILASLPMRGRCLLLHVGCGSGLLCELAASIGVTPAGLDRSPDLIALARARLPSADFRSGDPAELPFGAGQFDAVVMLHPVADAPVRAILREARRVARPGAAVVLAAFGPAMHCDAAGLMSALASVSGQQLEPWSRAFELSAEGALERAATDAKLSPVLVEDVECRSVWPDRATASRALLSSEAAGEAAARSGEPEVASVLAPVLDRLRTPDGRYRYVNRCRFVIAATPRHRPEAA